MNVLFSSRQASIKDLPSFSGTVIRELYRYVADLDLLVCGPQYWIYYGMDGRPETKFTLEIALPVHGKVPTGLLPYFKRIPAYRCLTARYTGSWEGLGELYREMFQYVEDHSLTLNGVNAESYLHIDPDEPDSQITEIRIGLLN